MEVAESTVTVRVCSFQPTRAPRLSAMNLAGTKVRPPTMVGGTSSVTLVVFTVAEGLSICRVIVFSARFPVMVRVASFHSTDAPNASKIARSGTKVLPLRMIGDTSITNGRPFTTTLMGCSADTSGVFINSSATATTTNSFQITPLGNTIPLLIISAAIPYSAAFIVSQMGGGPYLAAAGMPQASVGRGEDTTISSTVSSTSSNKSSNGSQQT
ncbi:MAG: hypothetical protein DDT34_02230 [Firmicutes bacterium]|nr:hypothetical protein [Bacillota bacterium]